jgi:hypothetical protein
MRTALVCLCGVLFARESEASCGLDDLSPRAGSETPWQHQPFTALGAKPKGVSNYDAAALASGLAAVGASSLMPQRQGAPWA